MIEIVHGLKFRQMDNLTDNLEMDENVVIYQVEKTGDNEYSVTIVKNK